MTLAIGNATVLAILGIVALAAGGILLQRARRVANQAFSLASSMADRRFVFNVDAPTEATLPSRFNRGTNAPPRPATELPRSITSHSLADELESLELPPGPGSVGLTHRRKPAPNGRPGRPPAGVAAAPRESTPAETPEPEREGVQEPLPLAYGPPGTPAPAPAPVAAGRVTAADPFPAGGLRWTLPDPGAPPRPPAPPEATAPPAAPAATASPGPPGPTGATAPPAPPGPGDPERRPMPGDGAPDFATLVREYIRALRWKVD